MLLFIKGIIMNIKYFKSNISNSSIEMTTLLADNDLNGKIFTEAITKCFTRVSYGSDENNYFDLRMPQGKDKKLPIAIVIHGGFWRNKYSLDYMSYFCEWLKDNGIVSINVEYRRIGDIGGGYPSTFLDIAQCIDSLPNTLKRMELFDIKNVDLNDAILIGHSSGGHLAAWAFSRKFINKESPLYNKNAILINRVISLAGVLDLHHAQNLGLSENSVNELINSKPFDLICSNISPIEMPLPVKGKVMLFHGDKDDNVPLEMSMSYQNKNHKNSECFIVSGAGHFDLVNPNSFYFKKVSEKILNFIRNSNNKKVRLF